MTRERTVIYVAICNNVVGGKGASRVAVARCSYQGERGLARSRN